MEFRERDQELKLASALLLLGAAVFLVMAHAYLSEEMTEIILKAKHAVEKAPEKPAQKLSELLPELERKDVPPDFEVRSAAQVQEINAGTYPNFDAGRDD